jgi:hypothetical protein
MDIAAAAVRGIAPAAVAVARGIFSIAAITSLLAGCSTPDDPKVALRAVVTAGEEAAEARDLSALMDFVSPAFADEQVGDREGLKNYLRGYLMTHQSVHLLTRIDEIEFPYRDYARVELTVGTLGRETASATAFDVAADVHDLVLELQLVDDKWKVVRAERRSERER